MEYKEYRINVYWEDEDEGFQYKVYNPSDEVVAESEEPFFFYDNALKEAKEIIDGLAG